MSGLNQPDDLLFSNGSLYIGELGAGRIHVLTWGVAPRTLPVHVRSVEGMVQLGGVLYAADQIDDRVVAINGTSSRTVFQLVPVSGLEGVDDITAEGADLVVPDSPRGVVDWVTPAGKIVKQVGGFERPTGAWPLAGGSMLVADENAGAVVHVSPTGLKTDLRPRIPIVDDVAEDGSGAVLAINAVASAELEVLGAAGEVLVRNLGEGQGLTLDQAGNAFISEETAGRVDLVIRSFKLVPLGAADLNGGEPVCIKIQRAPGFTAPITLYGSGGAQVVRQPGVGDQGSVRLDGCVPNGCSVTARSGRLEDTLEVTAA